MIGREKISEILRRLKKEYPEAKTALNFSDPFQLLAATILSAQATDVLVNKITVPLFRKYKTVKDYANAPLEMLQQDVKSINFYKTKAKNIQAAAQIIEENFHGRVPDSMDALVSLPGVARKTANIVLTSAYGINDGIAVDTHVKRLSNLLGLTKNQDPVKIEQDLIAITPQKEWGNLSNLLIAHGRKICQAKKMKHGECVLFDICPSRNK
jgi:endonuclease III